MSKKLGLGLGLGMLSALALSMFGCLGAPFTAGTSGTSTHSGGAGGTTGTTTDTSTSSGTTSATTTTDTASVTGTSACQTGWTDCNGTCVNLKNDAQNCGACGQSCGGICCAGVCKVDDADFCGTCSAHCNPGETCTNGSCGCSVASCATNNVCTTSAYDGAACGTAVTPCKACEAKQVCGLLGCACRPRLKDACLSLTGTTETCIDLTTNPQHCGQCDTVCEVGSYCVDGSCQSSCDSGFTLCGSACVKDEALQYDALHCGSGCAQCANDELCYKGTCTKYFGMKSCSADVCGSKHTCCPLPNLGAICVAGKSLACDAATNGL